MSQSWNERRGERHSRSARPDRVGWTAFSHRYPPQLPLNVVRAVAAAALCLTALAQAPSQDEAVARDSGASDTLRADLDERLPTAERLLMELDRRYRTVRAAEGAFVQKRTSPLFIDDVWSTGAFYYLSPNPQAASAFRREGLSPFWHGGLDFGCEMRIETGDPSRSPVRALYRTTGAENRLHLPDSAQTLEYRWGSDQNPVQRVHPILLGLAARAYDITEYFEVGCRSLSGGRSRLRLSPWYPPQVGGVRLVWIDFDDRDLHPIRIHTEQDGGERTDIFIKRLRINPPIRGDASGGARSLPEFFY